MSPAFPIEKYILSKGSRSQWKKMMQKKRKTFLAVKDFCVMEYYLYNILQLSKVGQLYLIIAVVIEMYTSLIIL
jgi:hypothetical protein